jgi:hypothetical protein
VIDVSYFHTVLCDDEVVEIEVNRDGDLIFYDYDIDEDLALVEIGERSQCGEMAIDWETKPITVLLRMMYLDQELALLLAADWVQHAFEQLSDEEQEESEPIQTEQMLEQIRAVAHHSGDKLLIGDLWRRHVKNREGHELFRPSLRMYNVGRAAGSALAAASGFAYPGFVNYVEQMNSFRDSLGRASGFACAGSIDAVNERSWQIRRFVDVMGSHQRREPYPSLEATE